MPAQQVGSDKRETEVGSKIPVHLEKKITAIVNVCDVKEEEWTGFVLALTWSKYSK